MGRFSNRKEVSYYRLGYDYKGKELGGLNIKKKKKRAMNTAMLINQAWRLWMNLD